MNYLGLATEEDIARFLHVFGWFPDTIIKEVALLNHAHINSALTFKPGMGPTVRLLLQRQWKAPSCADIVLLGVREISLKEFGIIDGGRITLLADGVELNLGSGKIVALSAHYAFCDTRLGSESHFTDLTGLED